MKKFLRLSRLRNQRGATAIVVGVSMFMLLGFAAIAIDLGHLYVARNELKNAADAGALAGAQVLYNEDGTVINAGANQTAHDIATANKSEGTAVEVNFSGNTGDVQRGHWSFGIGTLARGFSPNDSTDPVDLMNVSTAGLDANPDFINAVKVKTRRETTPVASFFARIFGYENFKLSQEAVAYIGFSGKVMPADIDQPIAICKQSITDGDGNYTCSTGRMINSGGGTTHNSGAWTNFSQPCETANKPTVDPLVCSGGNPLPIDFGRGIGTTGGMVNPVYDAVRTCWLNAPLPNKDWRGYPTEPWSLTLPVIDCPENNPGICSDVVGTVTLDVIWIKQSGTDPDWTDIPLKMKDWECPSWVGLGRPPNINSLDASQRQQCWQAFASKFNLHTADGTSVGTLTPSDIQKTMFFLPSCEPHEAKGTTGGENFGVLAKIPVLVE